MSKIYGPALFIIRFILFFIYSFFVAFFAVLCRLLPKWESVKFLTQLSKLWAYGAARIFGIKVKIYGNKKNVRGFIVSNHLSYMDILLLGSIFPLRFAPKSDIAKWPVLGWILASSRPIWVDRSSKHASINTVKEFTETIEHGINLLAFPEGTTGNGKGDLFPFKSTAFEAAASSNAAVCPVLIVYKQANISWAVDDPTPLIIHLWRALQMIKITAELHILNPVLPAEGKNRKELCQDIYHIMNQKYLEIISSNKVRI